MSGNHLPFAFWSMMGPDVSRLAFNLLSISLRSLANLKKEKKAYWLREMAVLSFPQNGQCYSSIVPMITRLFGVSSDKDTNPIVSAPSSWPHLITSQWLHLQILSQWGLAHQHAHLRGDTHILSITTTEQLFCKPVRKPAAWHPLNTKGQSTPWTSRSLHTQNQQKPSLLPLSSHWMLWSKR